MTLLLQKMQQNLSETLCVFIYPRANGAKRRSGRKPGARVTNLALAIANFKVSICDREYGWSSSLISKL